MLDNHTLSVLDDVEAERRKQDKKWGTQTHTDPVWLTILSEEVGESAQEILTQEFGASAKGHGNLREELIHSAAVLVAWIEDIDRSAA